MNCPQCHRVLMKQKEGYYNTSYTHSNRLPTDWDIGCIGFKCPHCRRYEYLLLSSGDLYNYQSGTWLKVLTLSSNRKVPQEKIIGGKFIYQI